MNAELRTSAISDFQMIRDDFLSRLEKYSKGELENKTFYDIQTELRRLRNTLSMWSLIPEGDETGTLTCFKARCNRLEDATEKITNNFADFHRNVTEHGLKMFEMLTIQLGRLTLKDSTGTDEKAGEWSIKAEMEQRKWESRNPADDTDDEDMLRMIWCIMQFKMVCPCKQCMGRFIPGNGA
ncbi:hypothetical protein N7456_007817 [Penicillium angulare]|uniref:Uncharacterized protein n=1 Tax=Penicillium angulare TaxID=116970 RepID=A0A9W9K935_9EURO|nr:hypothetical protein N7456_007817 [Penicillium angulare]